MQRIPREQARTYAFDWRDAPLLRVKPGESFGGCLGQAPMPTPPGACAPPWPAARPHLGTRPQTHERPRASAL